MALERGYAGRGRVVARLARLLEAELQRLDLTLSQYRTLAALTEGEAVAVALARRLAVSPPNVTKVMDGLVARGLVLRVADLSDRRRVSHGLTSEGWAVVETAEAALDACLVGIAQLLDAKRSDRALTALDVWAVALEENRRAVLPALEGRAVQGP